MFLFQPEQGADGLHVPGIFLLCAALAQMLVRDTEVPGRFRDTLRVQGFIQGSGIREGLYLSVDHNRDGQLVQFFIRQLRLVRLLLPQCILELRFVDDLIVPRMTVRTGVDAHIGFTNIADSALDRSGRQVYHNFVPNLIDGCFLRCCTLFFFLIGQVSPGLDHQVDILFDRSPFQLERLPGTMQRKFHPGTVVGDKTAPAIQIGVAVPTDAVFLCQCPGALLPVWQLLVELKNSLFAASIPGAVAAQFVFNFRLRQNKSGERFFALRLVYILDLLGFGGDACIQKT